MYVSVVKHGKVKFSLRKGMAGTANFADEVSLLRSILSRISLCDVRFSMILMRLSLNNGIITLSTSGWFKLFKN